LQVLRLERVAFVMRDFGNFHGEWIRLWHVAKTRLGLQLGRLLLTLSRLTSLHSIQVEGAQWLLPEALMLGNLANLRYLFASVPNVSKKLTSFTLFMKKLPSSVKSEGLLEGGGGGEDCEWLI